jgi:predicted dehydrogenase
MAKQGFDVAIIGLNHGLRTILPAIAESPSIDRVYLAASHKTVGKKIDVDSNRFEVVSFESILQMHDTRVVFVASPPATHLELVRKSLARKKAVYCEKPGGTKTSDLELMIQFSKFYETPLTIGYQYKHDPYIQFMNNYVRHLGANQIQEIEIDWKTQSAFSDSRQNWKLEGTRGGEVTRDFLTHVLDYLDFCFPHIFNQENSDDLEIEVETLEYDRAHIYLRIKNLNLKIKVSRMSKDKASHNIKIIGRSGSLAINRFFPYGLIHGEILVNEKVVRIQDSSELMHQLEQIISNETFSRNLQIYAASVSIKKFLRSVDEGNDSWSCDLERTLRITRVVDLIESQTSLKLVQP